MVRRLPIVGVLGQGTPLPAERAQLAREAGALVARLGAHLLTGAGYGTMAAAAESFTATAGRAGLSIGIVPRREMGTFDEPNRDAEGRVYPNPFVEIAIFSPLPPRTADWHNLPARNHINILTSDALIALPGGRGTANELDMAAFYREEAARVREARRTVLFGPAEDFSAAHRELFVQTQDVDEVERHILRTFASRGISSVSGTGHVRIDA